MTDPTGLNADDACNSGPMNLATCLTREYLGGGGGCSIDGGQADCGVAFGLAAIGAAAQCPGNICSGFADLGNGRLAFAQFDANDGMFDVIGKAFYPGLSPEQELDAINAQMAAVIDALEAKGATDTQVTAFIKAASNHFSDWGLHGGNYDFADQTVNSADKSTSFSSEWKCPQDRCDLGSLGTLDFSHGDGSFHLDTADPYNLLRGGIFVHGLVDVVLGNVWYQVIPRPWP